ncbi:MAG TPA: hypothetical protein VM100_07045 [Longimicrobiales bacterium]|nr:hypothetical protein [Longimicrobiales bacterium]
MKVLLSYHAHAEWQMAFELCRSLERDGVHFVLAFTDGPLAPWQRAELRGLRNVQFVESTYRMNYEIDRVGDWLLDMARRYDVDLVQVSARFSHIKWGRPVVIDPLIPIARSGDNFGPRRKEPMIAVAGDYDDPTSGTAVIASLARELGWPVFVLGNAPKKPGIDDLSNTHFLGPRSIEETSAILGRAALFVRLSNHAGFDVLDAALSGCALVLADNADMKKYWDGAAVFAKGAANARSLIEWLMNDGEARGGVAERCLQRASSFSAERMASGYLTLYIDAHSVQPPRTFTAS